MRKIIRLAALLVCLFSVIMLYLLSAKDEIKLRYEFKGTDPKSAYVKKYFMSMAKDKGLYFNDNIPIGFKKIGKGKTIGECWYFDNKREIIFDTEYWATSNDIQKIALSFHEFAHCYCGRDHDFGKGIKYPETHAGVLFTKFSHFLSGTPVPGYMEDGCPSSLMHPSMPKQECLDSHYEEYLDEVFNRCEPW